MMMMDDAPPQQLQRPAGSSMKSCAYRHGLRRTSSPSRRRDHIVATSWLAPSLSMERFDVPEVALRAEMRMTQELSKEYNNLVVIFTTLRARVV